MSDFISAENTTYDAFAEHDLHTEYDPKCSTCYELKKHREKCTPDDTCKLCLEKYAVTCNHGTLYNETCTMCRKETKINTNYNIGGDNFPPGYNSRDYE